MPIPFIAQLAIGFGLLFIGYMLMPKPKPPKPPSVEDLKEPTAEAGRPIPVPFGSVQIDSPNILFYGDKDINHRSVGSGGGKK